MTADAASPDTPTDPARELTMHVARQLPADSTPVFVAGAVYGALRSAGLLSLSGDSTQTTDGQGSLRSRASGTPAQTGEET